MNSDHLGLLITFLLGLFIVLGAILAFFLQKKQKVLDFIFALAFSLLTMLIIMDLLPEIIEMLGLKYIWLFLLFGMLGLLLFKILDGFVPEHHDHKMSKAEKIKNVSHIGTLATIALMIHNIVEGMAIFIATASDTSLGIMMSTGVGLHNIPLGMIVSTTFYQSGEKKSKYLGYLAGLSLTPFLGGFIAYAFRIVHVNPLVMGSLLSLTLGMLIYIIIFELFPKIKETTNKKMSILGLILGVAILLVTIFFE